MQASTLESDRLPIKILYHNLFLKIFGCKEKIPYLMDAPFCNSDLVLIYEYG